MRKDEFSESLYTNWLPSFCNARDRSLILEGFVRTNLESLSEFDANWFLKAIKAGYVEEQNGFFWSDLSKAKEQILWEGSKSEDPRKIYLWLEPIITIGALARLIDEFHWPQSQVGLQSKAPWPFDLMGYDVDRETELLACEVKKSNREVDRLIEEMMRFSAIPKLETDPEKPTVKNAYRKVAGIRKSWPNWFWVLGPNGNGQVFEVAREPDSEIFSLNPTSLEELRF